ncbi:MAG: thioesterase [Lachnospiraceae bacterium]|nr:thioesterase [Lachnospiraceae bacterium]
MSYEFASRIRFSEMGPDGRLTLGGLIDYFQNCAVFHSTSLGLGPLDKPDRYAAWIIISWRIVINRLPFLNENVYTKTWGHRFRTLEGDRNHIMTAESGELLAYSDSRWVFFDLDRQRPVKVPEEELAYGTEPKLDMGNPPRKIILPDNRTERDRMRVTRLHLDTNGHMNNGQYVHLAESYVPPTLEVGMLWVDYYKQALEGDSIIFKTAEMPEGLYVSLENEAAEAYAAVFFGRRVD